MNPELLGSFLSARPTGRQFGPARIAAVPIWFHWGVVASDPASAFEDVLSLDTILARKKKIMQIPEKLLQYQVYQLLVVDKLEGLDVSSLELIFFFGCPDRCGLVIYKQDMKAGFLPTQPDPNPCGKKNILPKTGLWNPCFFWAQQGRLVASVQSPPETFAKKPIWLHCNRHTSRGLWKQPGPRMRVHNHLPIFWKNTDIISPKHCLRDLFRIYPIFRHVYSNML